MRALLCFLPVVLAGCHSLTIDSYALTQREILRRSKVEISRREPWAGSAALFMQEPEDFSPVAWRVRAGAYDRAANYPIYRGIYFVPGTERELEFSDRGCLIGYTDLTARCPNYDPSLSTTETVMYPEK